MLTVLIDLIDSGIKMLIAMAINIMFALAVGIVATRSKKDESVSTPLLVVLQSIPILGFFPKVIL